MYETNNISKRTVENQRARKMKKLGGKNDSEMLEKAKEINLID